MKISRDYLKGIVKECLLELLNEGLGSAPVEKRTTEQRVVSRRGVLAPISVAQPARVTQSAALREAVKQESGGDPVLASILADTAKTTLPQFLAGDRGQAALPSGPGSSHEQRIVAQTTPEQLFGEENTSRWANLAFMDAPSGIKKTA